MGRMDDERRIIVALNTLHMFSSHPWALMVMGYPLVNSPCWSKVFVDDVNHILRLRKASVIFSLLMVEATHMAVILY